MVQQAMALSDDDRAALVAELMTTLPSRCEQDADDLTAAQCPELQRRTKGIERGGVR